jgi:Tfp pilus assembly protein PilV
MSRSLRFWQRAALSVMALILALTGLAQPQAAAAAEVFRFHDQFAIAGFRSTDPTGCIRTTVLLVAGRDVEQEPPGPPTRTSGATLRITQVDSCTGTFVSGSGSVSGVNFQSNPSARQATLTATIPVRLSTPTGTTVVNVPVNITWTATGAPDSSVNRIHFHFPDLIINAQFRGITRPAVATGTILLNGINLTPNPSVSGEISFETQQEVRIELP